MMRIARLCLAAAALLACTALPVNAQDKPAGTTGMSAPAAEKSVHEGPYIGLTAGLAAANLDIPGGLGNLGDQSFFGGAYIGYGLVSQGVYYGVELDGMLRDIKPGLNDGVASVELHNKWLTSARGRIGVPFGPVLVYGTGGVAMQQSALKLTDTTSASDTNWVYGYVGGVGIEAQLTNTVALRIEGLHYGWRDQTFTTGSQSASISQSDNVVRVGIQFKLWQ